MLPILPDASDNAHPRSPISRRAPRRSVEERCARLSVSYADLSMNNCAELSKTRRIHLSKTRRIHLSMSAESLGDCTAATRVDMLPS